MPHPRPGTDRPRPIGGIRAYVVVASLLLLGACAGSEAVQGSSCTGGVDEIALASIDWESAQKVEVDIRERDFDPMVVSLLRDRPYVLVIKNADRGSRTWRAPDFFATLALQSASVNGKYLLERCLTEVTLPARAQAEFRFVPLREGRYALSNGVFRGWLAGYDSGHGFGAIYVR